MKKLNLEAAILDLDGTLVDSSAAYLEAAKTAFAAIGREMNVETSKEIPRRLEQYHSLGSLIDEASQPKFLKAYLGAYYRATATKTRVMPGIHETLQRLSQKTRLALLTMRFVPKESVIAELGQLGLAEHFQFVMTALDTCHPKPSPEPLIECARQLGVQTKDCVVVGDSVVDVRAGKKVGARTIAVSSGIFTAQELEKENPDLILKSINQLPDLLA